MSYSKTQLMMWLFSCAIAGLLQGVFPTHLSGKYTIHAVAGSGAAHGAAHITQYVFYRHGASYNEARAICLEIGGDLAKVESVTKQSWIKAGGNDAIFDTEDIWTGLTMDDSDSPVWVPDCSTDVSAVTISTDEAEAEKKCFLLRKESFTFEPKSCTEDKFFLCELYIVVNATDCDVDPSYTDSDEPNNDCNSLPNSTSTTSTTSTVGTTSSTTSTAGTSSTSTHTAGTTSPTTSTAGTTSRTTSSSGTTSASTTSSTTLSTIGTISTSTSTVAPVTPASTPVTTTASTSTSGGTTVPPATVAALVCVSASNITVAEAIDLAAEISKNLTIDAKKTSAHRRSLESAEDNRSSAKAIGYLGICIVVVPFGVIFLSDIYAIINGVRHYKYIFKELKK